MAVAGHISSATAHCILPIGSTYKSLRARHHLQLLFRYEGPIGVYPKPTLKLFISPVLLLRALRKEEHGHAGLEQGETLLQALLQQERGQRGRVQSPEHGWLTGDTHRDHAAQIPAQGTGGWDLKAPPLTYHLAALASRLRGTWPVRYMHHPKMGMRKMLGLADEL